MAEQGSLRLFGFEIKRFTPYFTILIAILLVSKIPTLALKKISTISKFLLIKFY